MTAKIHPPTLRVRLALCAATPLLLWLSFPPADLGLVAWVAYVPFLYYVSVEERRGRLFGMSFLAGLLYYVPSVHWIRYVSIPAWIALAVYVALYVPLFAALVKLLVPRVGIRFYLGVPLILVACERMKQWVISGFPWFELGHTQHARPWLLQCADLAGAQGLSFLVALANALGAGLVALLVERGRAGMADKKWWGSVAGFAALLAAALVYGHGRLATARRIQGPEVGIVQGNLPQDVKELQTYRSDEEWARLEEDWWRSHAKLTDEMLRGREGRPDMVVWAETMVPWAFVVVRGQGEYPQLSVPRNRRLDRLLSKVREEWRCWFLGGVATHEYDVSNKRWWEYNSAYLLGPSARWKGRYDKTHLVVLGEYVPKQEEWPWVDGAIQRVSKLVSVPNLKPGSEYDVFSLDRDGWRFGTPICYEIMYADLCREFTRRGATFLVTLSNDGWFKDSEELDQILIVTKFRAVECRIGIVRATNTGVSAFITPWGEAETLVGEGGRTKEVAGTMVGRVLLRYEESFYARHGDLLGRGSQTLVLGLAGAVLAVRLGRRWIWRRPAVG